MPNSTSLSQPIHNPGYAQLFPAAVFLFILPFTHTIGLRLTALAAMLGVCIWLWFRQSHPSLPLKLPFALWAGVAATSMLWTVDFDYSAKEFKHEILFGIVTFFCFFILTRSRRELNFFIYVICAAVATMSIMAIYNWLPSEKWNSAGYQGGVGTFSTYMLLTLPWLIALLFLSKRSHTRLMSILLVVSAIGTAYLTLSRAFWPALLLQFITLVLLAIFRKRKRLQTSNKPTIIGAGLLAIITVTSTTTLVSVVDQKKNTKIDTTEKVFEILASDARIPIWLKAKEHFQKSPWLGIGFGREIATKNQMPIEAKQQQVWPYNLEHAHNTVINYAIELGVAGVICFVILFGALICAFYIHLHDPKREIQIIAICMLALILGFLMKNMTDDFFHRDLSLLFWASMGMGLGYIHWNKFQKAETAD